MTATAEHIIEDFEALPDPEKWTVLAKLLGIAKRVDYGPISDEEMLTLADELFTSLDREESELTLSQLVAGITPENCHSEVETGGPVGNEAW